MCTRNRTLNQPKHRLGSQFHGHTPVSHCITFSHWLPSQLPRVTNGIIIDIFFQETLLGLINSAVQISISNNSLVTTDSQLKYLILRFKYKHLKLQVCNICKWVPVAVIHLHLYIYAQTDPQNIKTHTLVSFILHGRFDSGPTYCKHAG